MESGRCRRRRNRAIVLPGVELRPLCPPDVLTGPPRPQDSAITTAQAFAEQLAAAGATVSPGVERGKGLPPAKELAAAESATVNEQVDLMLESSDNFLAEALGRMTALASGQKATYDGATAAVRQRLAELGGIATDSMQLADVSGLAWRIRSRPASLPRLSGLSPAGRTLPCAPPSTVSPPWLDSPEP